MKPGKSLTQTAASLLLCLGGPIGLLASGPCRSADTSATDTSATDISEMKRAIEELRAQNRALLDRVATLEAQRAGSPVPVVSAAAGDPSAPAAAVALAAPSAAVAPTGPAAPPLTSADDLARRVQELEFSRMAQNDATRAIIRDSLAKTGSKATESVSLGGAVEMLLGRSRDFSGTSKSSLALNTAELDFDIQASPWATANLKVGFNDGSSQRFVNTAGFESGVDRFSVDSASITVGDLQRFPVYFKAGLMNLAFGSSTGTHRADVLSIDSPLTTDAFELRRAAIGFGFGLPTPPLRRADLPVVAPPVRPLVVAPLVAGFARQLGYAPPPERPKPPTPISLPPEPPPFYGSLLLYQGHNIGAQRSFARNANARLGYRTGGHCGKRYSELRSADFCPWSLDFNIDYNTSVFDSRFLETEYRPFLGSFGPVRGLASTIKLALGPVSVVGEWNGAIARAVFQDDVGRQVGIKPSAWQVALGYQFDWNPWVEAVGSQGTYLALGYSQSRDLAGVTRVLNNQPSRVGNLPRSRWTLTAGEWVLEGLKVQLEYSRLTDYTTEQGGTGASASAIQMTLTYAW